MFLSLTPDPHSLACVLRLWIDCWLRCPTATRGSRYCQPMLPRMFSRLPRQRAISMIYCFHGSGLDCSPRLVRDGTRFTRY